MCISLSPVDTMNNATKTKRSHYYVKYDCKITQNKENEQIYCIKFAFF